MNRLEVLTNLTVPGTTVTGTLTPQRRGMQGDVYAHLTPSMRLVTSGPVKAGDRLKLGEDTYSVGEVGQTLAGQLNALLAKET